MAKNPLLLGAAFLCAALLGAGLFMLVQRVIPGANPDKVRFEAMMHDYILDHGELLPEAMDRVEQKRIAERDKTMNEAPKYVAAHRADIANPYSGAMQGNPQGNVTVSAFLDYNCGYCRASLPAIAELVKRDPNVRIVYREFPVLANSSVIAARWALAAAEQGKFLAFHHSMYGAGHVDDDSIATAATVAGLDKKVAEQTIEAPRVQQEIEKNRATATALGSSNATPFWVVGDKVLSGMLTYDQLAAAVAEARKGKS